MYFFRAIIYSFQNAFNYSGRACRAEYFSYHIFVIAMVISMDWLRKFISLHSGIDPVIAITGYLIIIMLVIIPAISSFARRLHDVDKDFWQYNSVDMVPIIGSFIILQWLFQKGTNGPNRFGPDPLAYEDL